MQRRRTRSFSWLGCLALLGVSQGALAQAPAQAAPAEPAPSPTPEAPAEATPAEAAPAEAAPAETAPAEAAPAETPAPAPQPPADTSPSAAAAAAPAAATPAPAEPPAAKPAPEPAPSWGTEPATPTDTGVEAPPSDAAEQKPKLSRWRASRIAFENSVTAQTLGIGDDYQSDNDTYDWTLWFRPRYYFLDRDNWSYSVRAIFGITQELTNSDSTTQTREFDVGTNDTILQLRYDRTLYEDSGYLTRIGLGLPEITIPTSKASRNNGRILGLGAGLVPSQAVPLMQGAWLSSLSISGLARYHHYFTNAEVPTNDDIDQDGTDLDGGAVISDQLSASPFAKHETRFGFGTELAIHDKLLWATDFQWRPTWNYDVDHDAEICGLPTGCTEVDGTSTPETFEVVTVFATEFEAYAFDSVSFTLGYINIANQIGADGQRRSMFYSPDARFYFTVNFYPGEVLDPGQAPKHVATAPRAFATF